MTELRIGWASTLYISLHLVYLNKYENHSLDSYTMYGVLCT